MEVEDDSTTHVIVNGTVKSFYVRTKINFNADYEYSLPIKGLSYEQGEILYVKNASDIDWWRAKKFSFTKMVSNRNDEGIIPSAERLRKKYINKDLGVNFEEKTTVIDANGQKISNKINETATRGTVLNMMKRNQLHGYSQDYKIKYDSNTKPCEFYEIVDILKYSSARPVVVVGPGRSNLYDKLVEQFPNMFASPINHTTRLKRESEVDGIDYHFVESKEEFKKSKETGLFVETVEYNDQFYGTSLLAVKNVMASNRHCIIDATIEVIKNLEANGIFPITILICTDSFEVAKSLMGEHTNDKLIRTTMQYSAHLNQSQRSLFTVKLSCSNMLELLKDTYTAVINCQKLGVWIRSDDQSRLSYDIP